MSKSQRTEHAREVTQAKTAQADRPASPPGTAEAAPDTADQAKVTPLRWPERAQQAHDSIGSERRRRREAAVPVIPEPPPRLGASFRERNVFLLPDDDEGEQDRGPATRG